ncbi:flagellin N-terminal helical domain-containing protein [Butyrivibrio sp. AE2032]|uniref:flagellin N-terminal helical domain-containing protein n=1 Tax=Butyrivibrio sp. AE2032 TaxID=1458463 RepID=UPI00055408A6|nr:flagellin [Butyrivibrio sp. AE2032]
MVIQHNLSAMNSNRQLGITTGIQAKSSEKLSSGYKINRAADDAAGLAISEKMRRQVRGLNQGSENIQDGISLLQVGDSALVEVQDMLQRMNELCIKAANDTLQSVDRSYIQQEINQLKEEIDHISATASFNERLLFDDLFPGEKKYKKLSDVIKSSAAETGGLTEAFQKNGRWYPAANMDLTEVDANVVKALDGKGFSFTCAASCSEVFEFSFDTSTSSSRIEGSTQYSRGTHKYIIGIADCKNGEDIVDKIFEFAYNNPLNGMPASKMAEMSATSVPVSHTNTIERTGPAKFVLWGNVGGGYPTADGAKNHTFSPGMGRVDCSSMDINIESEIRDLWIQTGPEITEGLYLTINRINSEVVGVNDVDVSSHENAKKGIEKVKTAIITISTERSNLGAQQNRLEHSYKNNRNIEENTQAAESRIRDTDMATEMVRYSNSNILAQAGQSMLAQANQTNQGVLSLLQ